MSVRIRSLALCAALAGAALLGAVPAGAQVTPAEPGGRDPTSFYDPGVPGLEARSENPGFPVDFSGKVRRGGVVGFSNRGGDCHSHSVGVEGVPFHSDIQCHSHAPDTPGVVPAR